MILSIIIFYSFIFINYSLDFLDFFITEFSKNYSSDFMLTQFEDLTIILFNLVNYSLFLVLFFTGILQIFFYFIPAFFIKEKKFVLSSLNFFILSFFVSFFLCLISFNLFYSFYSDQLFFFNFDTSTKIIFDLKVILNFCFEFLIFIFFFSLPINYFLCLSSLFIKIDFYKINLFFFIVMYLLGWFFVENSAQLGLYFLTQFFQLELLALFKFFYFKHSFLENSL